MRESAELQNPCETCGFNMDYEAKDAEIAALKAVLAQANIALETMEAFDLEHKKEIERLKANLAEVRSNFKSEIEYREKFEAENERLKAELAACKAQRVSVFYEDKFPCFSQGTPTHELQFVLTAEEANGMVQKILALKEGLRQIAEHEHLVFAEVPWPRLDGDTHHVESILRATKFKEGHVDGHRCAALIAKELLEKEEEEKK